ncbi:hypothetical protein ABIC09_002374 [Bradyrhizobium sp. S3.12.5]|uniref:WD40 repeat domain-containing protein n=1 Tax=Bradyrhizobium cytisi TaxID=515489 RepID=A0A5S4X1N5_9BRAD|nr:hypothetical protein [Bradyrhizobium cytisi]TYL83454.1 hypothetical protein FXB38_19620 [Bradyrhizobium cytisi]
MSIIRTKIGRWLAAAACFCCWALALSLLTTVICTAAARQQSSWNRSAELRRVGYVELFGEDAVHLLVGNSVLVQNSGPIDKRNGIEINEKIYYFVNDKTMYECGVAKEAGCDVKSWGLQNDQVCLEIGSCGERPKIMKSPLSLGRAKKGDKLGIYLWFDHFAYDIVKGNRTDFPLFDNVIRSKPIELDRAHFEKEINEVGPGAEEVPISGPRSVSLLIGNTFLSDDVTNLSEDRAANACPKEGTYYSPDGKVIRFACRDGKWSIAVLHWNIQSDLFCRDGPESDSIGSFNCTRGMVYAISASPKSSADNKMRVRDPKFTDSDSDLMGYLGNAFNFRFEQRHAAEKSGRSNVGPRSCQPKMRLTAEVCR